LADFIDLPIRIRATAINKYLRKLIAPIYPRAKLLGALQAHGRVSFNHDAPDIRWRIRVKRHTPVAGAGYPNPVDFVALQPIVEAVLPWRQYVLGEHIGDIERKVGRHDDTAFPRLIKTLVKDCMDDFQHWMQRVPYKDGYAGAANDMHGLESIFKASVQSGKAVGTLTSSTYAGQNMALGQLGGSWTGDWPAGDGSTEYCAWSNMVVDYTSTFWDPTTKTWPNTWQYALHFAHAWLLARQGEEPNICIMHPDLLRQAMDSQIPNQKFEVTANSKLTSLGIKTLNFNGLEIMEDAFCPSAVAYLLNLDRINLWCMDDQLVKSREQEDITTGTQLIRLDCFGNFWFESPAYLCKLAALTT
jgi:hypothetical protein